MSAVAPLQRNSRGWRIGQGHHRAKLTDAQVARMRSLFERGIGYKALAREFGCSVSTARDICRGTTRARC